MVSQRYHPVATGEQELPEAAASVPSSAAVQGWPVGRWRYLVSATVAAATLAWLLAALSGRAQDGTRVGLIVTGAVLTAIAVGLPLWQRRRALDAQADAISAARAARVAMRVALQDALDPFVHLIARLAQARASDKARLRGEAIQLTVATLAALAGTERVRVCYFALDTGAPTTLRPERFAGRAGAPTVTFVKGSAAGDAALRILSRGLWTYAEDTELTRPRFAWDADPAYRSFLAGPVATPQTCFGMLTLDALRPGELADLDLALVQLMSALLATALCL